MFQLLKQGHTIPFMRAAFPATCFSVVLIILAIVTLATKGLNWGLDFTGGTIVELNYEQPVELATMRTALVNQEVDGAVVQHFGSTKDVLIRIPPKGKMNQQQLSVAVTEAGKQVPGFAKLSRIEYVGPAVGEELAQNGFLAIIASLICILGYVAIRFEWRMATGAVLSLGHDVLITLGIFSWCQYEFDLTVLAAVLTVVGYSLNDTIVVFDRVRENFRVLRKASLIDNINISTTQTLLRTMATSLSTLMAVVALMLFGGENLWGFSLALFIGVAAGTYSSVYIASILLIWLKLTREDLIPPVVESAADDRP